MKFKNERLTLIHMPDNRQVMPDETFDLPAADIGNPGIKSLFRARWITPQDDEAVKAVATDKARDQAATQQRLQEIDAQSDEERSPAAKKMAHDNARTQAEAAAELEKQLTPLQERQVKLQAVSIASGEQLVALSAGETDQVVKDAIMARAHEIQIPAQAQADAAAPESAPKA